MLDLTSIIKDFSGNSYNIEDFISELLRYDKAGFDFYIGTDSQVFEKHVSIVTAICPRRVLDGSGTSGRVFYIKERKDRRDFPTLRSRMLMEAYRSLELAIDIDPHVKNKIAIHLDIGSGKRSETNKYCQELQYLVSAQGYECKIKPDSWAAGGAADRLSKS